MPKEFKVPSRKQPIFKVFKKILSWTFWRGIKVTVLPDKLPNKCIFVSNHYAKKGPIAYELAIPVFNVKWGAHEMLGNYKSRYRYLKYVFYMQKQGMSKIRATIKAAFEAIFSKMIYKGLKIIGTYQDTRLRTTLNNSIKVLEDDKAILIFPEDSNKGYFDEMASFFGGFVMLSELYYKKHKEDLPIYPIYYSHKLRKMVIGHPLYVQDFVKQGLNRDEIAEKYKIAVNDLYYKYFKKINNVEINI